MPAIYKQKYTSCVFTQRVRCMQQRYLKTRNPSSYIPAEEEPAMAEPAVDRELKNTIQQIEKQFGKGSIMQLGEGTTNLDVQGIPTGALSLDIALGGKGLPRGRVIEIYGPEASGKTTVALHAIASAQRGGGVAAFID